MVFFNYLFAGVAALAVSTAGFALLEYKSQIHLSEEKSATLVNQAHKIQHATNLFIKNEGSIPTKIDELIGKYISSIPDIPISTNGATWTLEKAKDRYNKPVDIVTVELPIDFYIENGATQYMCKTINKNSADLVFCTVSKHGIFNERNLTAGEGSAESVIDDIREDLVTAKAKIHMVI